MNKSWRSQLLSHPRICYRSFSRSSIRMWFLALPEVPVFLTGLKSVQVRQRKAQFWFNCRLHSPTEAKHIFTDGGFWRLSNMFLGFYLSLLWWKAKGATRHIHSNWSIMHHALQDLFWQFTGAITATVKLESITQVQEANNMSFLLGFAILLYFLLTYLIFTHVKNIYTDRLLDLFRLKTWELYYFIGFFIILTFS